MSLSEIEARAAKKCASNIRFLIHKLMEQGTMAEALLDRRPLFDEADAHFEVSSTFTQFKDVASELDELVRQGLESQGDGPVIGTAQHDAKAGEAAEVLLTDEGLRHVLERVEDGES